MNRKLLSGITPRFSTMTRPALVGSFTIALLCGFANLPAQAQQPLSYVLVNLDSTGLDTSAAFATGGGYAAGAGAGAVTGGDQRAMLWNIATNTRTALDNTGSSYATGVGNGYAVGYSGDNALAWNLATGARTTLNSTGLLTASAAGTSNGVAVGDGRLSTGTTDTFAMSWNLATNMRTTLNSAGLTESHGYAVKDGIAVGVGYGVGFGNPSPMAWNLSTNTRTTLSSADLLGAYAFGTGDGYAVGYGFTASSNGAMVWNLATNTRTNLSSAGLGSAQAYVVGGGYVGGAGIIGQGAAYRAQLWELASNTRTDIQSAFLPTNTFSSRINGVDSDGTAAGMYVLGGASYAFALVPFKAGQGDTLSAGKTAKVTGNLTQTTGTTTINGSYQFVGGTGNNTYTLAGGTLQGTGSITGNLANTGGTLAPGNSPGTFTVNGNFAQGAGGILNMEITSLASFDKLVVTGNATLGGTLNLTFAPGFAGSLPASFDLITTGGTLSGFFNTVNITGGLPTGANYVLNTSSVGTGGMRLTLVVVPEAGTLSLLALPVLGSVVIALRRKVA